jgi:hypothetical protein
MTLSDMSNDTELLSRCNCTELYQICRRLGLSVQPATNKEQMIRILLGEEPPPDCKNEADSWRDAIMDFLLDHWQTVRGLLDCPAKSGDSMSCYKCLDQQVVSCLVENKDSLVQIRSRRK